MREEGSEWGTHVYLWQIHFDIWQNQYNILKLNKIKFLKKEKKKKKKSICKEQSCYNNFMNPRHCIKRYFMAFLT